MHNSKCLSALFRLWLPVTVKKDGLFAKFQSTITLLNTDHFWASKIYCQIKVPVAKPHDLSTISGNYMVERETHPLCKVVSSDFHTHAMTNIHSKKLIRKLIFKRQLLHHKQGHLERASYVHPIQVHLSANMCSPHPAGRPTVAMPSLSSLP